MRKLLIISLLLIPCKKFAQSNPDIERSFLMHFLQENILILKNSNNEKKYNLENLVISVDSIGSYYTDVVFYKFILGKNIIKDKKNELEISFNSSSCNEYIIGYDNINNMTFRLKGFNGNDLLFLIDDISKLSSENISPRKILSELSDIGIGINFREIHRALLNSNFDAPCLKKCSDPLRAH